MFYTAGKRQSTPHVDLQAEGGRDCPFCFTPSFRRSTPKRICLGIARRGIVPSGFGDFLLLLAGRLRRLLGALWDTTPPDSTGRRGNADLLVGRLLGARSHDVINFPTLCLLSTRLDNTSWHNAANFVRLLLGPFGNGTLSKHLTNKRNRPLITVVGETRSILFFFPFASRPDVADNREEYRGFCAKPKTRRGKGRPNSWHEALRPLRRLSFFHPCVPALPGWPRRIHTPRATPNPPHNSPCTTQVPSTYPGRRRRPRPSPDSRIRH